MKLSKQPKKLILNLVAVCVISILSGCNAGTTRSAIMDKAPDISESNIHPQSLYGIGAALQIGQSIQLLTRILNVIRVAGATVPIATLTSELQGYSDSTLCEVLYLLYDDSYSPLFASNELAKLTIIEKIRIIDAIGNKLGIVTDTNPNQFANFIIDKYDNDEASLLDDYPTTLDKKIFMSIGLYQLYVLLLANQISNISVDKVKELLNQSNSTLQAEDFCYISNAFSNFFVDYNEHCANIIEKFINSSYLSSLINELVKQNNIMISKQTIPASIKISAYLPDKVAVDACVNYVAVLQLIDSSGTVIDGSSNNILVKLSYNPRTSRLEGATDNAKMVKGGSYLVSLVNLLLIERDDKKSEIQPISLLSFGNNLTKHENLQHSLSLSNTEEDYSELSKCPSGMDIAATTRRLINGKYYDVVSCVAPQEDDDHPVRDIITGVLIAKIPDWLGTLYRYSRGTAVLPTSTVSTQTGERSLTFNNNQGTVNVDNGLNQRRLLNSLNLESAEGTGEDILGVVRVREYEDGDGRRHQECRVFHASVNTPTFREI